MILRSERTSSLRICTTTPSRTTSSTNGRDRTWITFLNAQATTVIYCRGLRSLIILSHWWGLSKIFKFGRRHFLVIFLKRNNDGDLCSRTIIWIRIQKLMYVGLVHKYMSISFRRKTLFNRWHIKLRQLWVLRIRGIQLRVRRGRSLHSCQRLLRCISMPALLSTRTLRNSEEDTSRNPISRELLNNSISRDKKSISCLIYNMAIKSPLLLQFQANTTKT